MKERFNILLPVTRTTRSIRFLGVVHYDRHPPDLSADSDWDFYGYNEFQFMSECEIINEEVEDGEEMQWDDVTQQEENLFHAILNSSFSF